MSAEQRRTTQLPDNPSSPYGEFTATCRENTPASDYERWAAQHPGDPDEGCAWLDTGWAWVRGGDDERALRAFVRAAGFGGTHGRQAEAGIVHQLHALKRPQEADQHALALRRKVEADPADVDDLHVFDAMVEALAESECSEQALDWCLTGLEHAARLPDSEQVSALRRGLRISRLSLREELGLELDAEDQALDAELNEELREFSGAMQSLLDQQPRARTPDHPDDGVAFDGIVLCWARSDFPAVRARWPEATAGYGDDYDAYAALVQRETRGYAEAGAARIHLVTGILTDYEAYADRTGADPSLPTTRNAYGKWRALEERQHTALWPPARNGPCWCASGRKYKKCCGNAATN